MKIDSLESYEDVINSLRKKNRRKHLLFGNGFSIAYDAKIFSYNALSNFIDKSPDESLKELFKVINTKNFELIMRQLENFVQIAQVFNADTTLISKIQEASQTLKDSLIDAVKALHPEHVFEIPEEKSKSCFNFIQEYLQGDGKVFSTNYDLLLYWVLMRNQAEYAIDGFGRELENSDEIIKGEDPEFSSELIWGKHKNEQTVFYLHGTLPIFDTGIDIIKEQYDNQHYLLEKINNRMEKKEYPIFVTAGDAKEKLNHIMHNKYLSHCYEQLTTIEGSLVVFGFNFGEYDTHIIDAINKACHYGKRGGNKLHSVYIGVYSDEDLKHIERIENKFMCKVNKYNARTVQIW
jgi:hypothetical protein